MAVLERYTRLVRFEDSLKLYSPIVGSKQLCIGNIVRALEMQSVLARERVRLGL